MPLFRNQKTPKGSYWKHVNWDQFSEEKESFENADMDEPKAGIQKAKVLKITEVKPGQNFPTAKRGQGQLFRMQVWPKGFTPERQKHVQEKVEKSIHVDDYAEEGLGKEPTATSKQQLKAQALNAIARSTIPNSDVNRLQNTKIILGEESDGVSMGGYMDPNTDPTEIHGMRPPSSAANSVRDVYNDFLLMHEIGHAVDYKTNPHQFTGSYRSGLYNNGQINPVHEGVAMGYQLANFRTTRNQRRRSFKLMNELGRSMSVGYKAHEWEDDGTDDNRGIDPQDSFKRSRLTTYRKEKGLTPHPLQEQRNDAPYYRQDKLPGI